jgi:curved DNA-binding protein
MDYYSILGVSKTASQDEIKKAYRKLAMKHHPDRGGDAEMSAKINEAYNVLGNTTKRQQYDNPQPEFNFRTSGFGNGDPFEDIFANAFGFGRRQRPKQNKDIQLLYTLTLTDCFTGKSAVFSYNLPSGRNETLDVFFPAGIKNGDSLKLDGYGDDTFTDAPRGSLIIKIRVISESNWSLHGLDLHTTYKLGVFDLLLGCDIEISIPSGKTISLKIPKGTNPDTNFSINGHGLPDRKTGKQGKIIVKILTDVPYIDDLSTINKIRELKNEIDKST